MITRQQKPKQNDTGTSSSIIFIIPHYILVAQVIVRLLPIPTELILKATMCPFSQEDSELESQSTSASTDTAIFTCLSMHSL